jgi:hypothetical protein
MGRSGGAILLANKISEKVFHFERDTLSSRKTRAIRGSMVAREIDFEEKWAYVPTQMIQELFLSTPMATMSEYMEPTLRSCYNSLLYMERAIAAPYGRYSKS